MRRITRILIVALALGAGAASETAAGAQEAGLGGGSDVRAGSIIDVVAGTTIPPVHHVFADNPEDEPIAVEFRVDAPAGITVAAERERFSIAPGDSIRVPFSIEIGGAVPPGDHQVAVQLVRADISARPGEVTNIPAVGTTFTLRVGGEAATVTVRARDDQSREPVVGTLTLTAVGNDGGRFEVARAEGAELSARVAPGEYRAAYLLGGREFASAETTVAGGDTKEVVLEVRAVSFVRVSAEPVAENGKVVVATLVASVQNHLQPIAGPIAIRASLTRDGSRVETVTIDELDALPVGVTEAKLIYRPAEGFPAGDYRVTFELVTDSFTMRAPTVPEFEVGDGSSIAGPAIAVAAGGVAALAAGGWTLSRRRVRARGRHFR